VFNRAASKLCDSSFKAEWRSGSVSQKFLM
jgi:hypothetical protein